MSEEAERQLELFSLENHERTRSKQLAPAGSWMFSVRYDHLMLASIGTLVGIAAIFACGVERGKWLAGVTSPHNRVVASVQGPADSQVKPIREKVTTQGTQPSKGELGAGREASVAPRPAEKPPQRKPSQANVSRYAIQVVVYRQFQLARQELQRLQAKGERAFLMQRDGRMVVYVGPFQTQAHANKKLVILKTQYQDCFIKTL